MEIKGKLNLSDYTSIYDYISLVESKDDFIINSKSVDKEDINIICSMLKERDFSINNKDFDNNGDCMIRAYKNL
jgi:presenilin-like A22 family membrane protease